MTVGEVVRKGRRGGSAAVRRSASNLGRKVRLRGGVAREGKEVRFRENRGEVKGYRGAETHCRATFYFFLLFFL